MRYYDAMQKGADFMTLVHVPVMLDEILKNLPEVSEGRYLDVTAGGGGHLSQVLLAKNLWKAQAWDRDPDARARVEKRLLDEGLDVQRLKFFKKDFAQAPEANDFFNFILADLGVSSFQLDDMSRGMSLRSEEALDFRMNPGEGPDFLSWLRACGESKLAECFYRYAEEPRAKPLARNMLAWDASIFVNAKTFAAKIASYFNYRDPSRKHPATRIFQALRIAINDELGQLESLLDWAPSHLEKGGRLAILSFHSLEDRLVKQAFKKLADSGDYISLYKRPLGPTPLESQKNPRSRSAKLRVLERCW